VTLILSEGIGPLVTGAVVEVMKAMHTPVYFKTLPAPEHILLLAGFVLLEGTDNSIDGLGLLAVKGRNPAWEIGSTT
jgi:hypothetical protein